MSEYAFEARSLVKSYENGLIPALRDVSLTLEHGKVYALMGRSGCGKSTLLNLIGTLDTPDNGTLLYGGQTLDQLGSLSRFRRERIGFVFQFHHLLPVLTLRENVETALLFHPHIHQEEKRTTIERIFLEMELTHKIDALASAVSGGERQRAAIARALVGDPQLILADEPTGNVDSGTSEKIMQTLRQRIKRTGATALIATHDPSVSAYADVRLFMKDGRIEAVENATLFS